jgi:hypothetical protein
MRTYMCLEAHEVKNKNLVTQHLLKCRVYFFLLFFFYFMALRRAFFVGPVFRKLRVKFGICTNLGNVCFFFLCWRLEIYLSLKLGGSTVWHLSPNRLRGDLTWGLPKLQIGWFNGLESLSPNKLRGDLTWGLPKLQIGWFQRFGIS